MKYEEDRNSVSREKVGRGEVGFSEGPRDPCVDERNTSRPALHYSYGRARPVDEEYSSV